MNRDNTFKSSEDGGPSVSTDKLKKPVENAGYFLDQYQKYRNSAEEQMTDMLVTLNHTKSRTGLHIAYLIAENACDDYLEAYEYLKKYYEYLDKRVRV